MERVKSVLHLTFMLIAYRESRTTKSFLNFFSRVSAVLNQGANQISYIYTHKEVDSMKGGFAQSFGGFTLV